MFAFIRAEEELSIEKLNCDDSKDELEENVNDQNVDDVLQRVDDAIEDCFQLRDTFDCFERTQHTKHSKWLDGGEVVGHFASTIAAEFIGKSVKVK